MNDPREIPDHAPREAAGEAPAATLPAGLDARIRAAERAAPPGDFGARGWLWMVLLGVALPLTLWALGWWA